MNDTGNDLIEARKGLCTIVELILLYIYPVTLASVVRGCIVNEVATFNERVVESVIELTNWVVEFVIELTGLITDDVIELTNRFFDDDTMFINFIVGMMIYVDDSTLT